MKTRNILLNVLLLILTFLSTVVYAQLDINKLKDGTQGFGFGYRPYTNKLQEGIRGFGFGYHIFPTYLDDLTQHNILLTGEHGFTENIKGSTQVTTTFLENVYEVLRFQSRNQIMYIDSLNPLSSILGGLDFGYFLFAGGDIAYLYVIEYVPKYYKVEESGFLGLSLFTGGGISVTLGSLKPFALYNFEQVRDFTGSVGTIYNLNQFSVGIHVNLSDSVSLMGRTITLDGFGEAVIEFGVNFGMGKKGKVK